MEGHNIDNVNVNVNAGYPGAVKQKSPIIAAIGSFLFPGLGQVYNGQGMLKGLLYLIGVFIGSIILVIPGLIIWVYGIYNAYSVAKKINAGLLPYKETSLLSIALYILLYFIICAVIAVIVVMFSAIIFAFIFAIADSTSSYSSY